MIRRIGLIITLMFISMIPFLAFFPWQSTEEPPIPQISGQEIPDAAPDSVCVGIFRIMQKNLEIFRADSLEYPVIQFGSDVNRNEFTLYQDPKHFHCFRGMGPLDPQIWDLYNYAGQNGRIGWKKHYLVTAAGITRQSQLEPK